MNRMRFFFRLFLRPLRREPARTGLTVIAVGLGVAVVLAIELAGDAATGSFRSSVETLAGKADFSVTAVGGVSGKVVARLATLPYPIRVIPQVTGYATVKSTGRVVPMLGVDLVANAARAGSKRLNLRWLRLGRCVWVSRGIAAKPGERIDLGINDRVASFTACGILPRSTGVAEESGAVVMDIATALKALGHRDRVDRVLIDLPRNSRRSMAQWETILRAALPPGVRLHRRGAEARENRRMLQAFRWNLRVLSYIALLVGAFLIYNSMSVSVVRRRTEIGVLRALGADRTAILGGFLGEAALYGLVGSALGLFLGRLMAQSIVGMIASTVESLYLTSRPAAITLDAKTVMLAFVLGVGVALASALLPAREAAQVPPAEAMARAQREHQARLDKRRNLVLAACCAVAAVLACKLPPVAGMPLFGYVASLLLVAAAALAVPFLMSGVAAAASHLPRRGWFAEVYLAVQSLAASLRRTAVLVAALGTAVSMVVSVAVMVGSFRKTVNIWLGQQLQADFYVQPAVLPAVDRFPTLSPLIARRIEALPEVAALNRFRAYPVSYRGMPATLGGADIRVAFAHGRFSLLAGEDRKKVLKLVENGAVIASEPFAVKRGIRPGQTLTLTLPGGPATFRVAGIYHDYSDPRGVVVMDRCTLLKYVPDRSLSSIAVYLRPGMARVATRQALDRACAGYNVVVLSHTNLRKQALAVFDRTFRITYALEAVALCVAIMGAAEALATLVIDRRREIALLRFVGSSARQVRRLIFTEAALLGLLAAILGFVLGVALSLVLIFVINKQSFGWTIAFFWPVKALSASLVLIYISTLAAGVYPARLGMALNPIEVIREE